MTWALVGRLAIGVLVVGFVSIVMGCLTGRMIRLGQPDDDRDQW